MALPQTPEQFEMFNEALRKFIRDGGVMVDPWWADRFIAAVWGPPDDLRTPPPPPATASGATGAGHETLSGYGLTLAIVDDPYVEAVAPVPRQHPRKR